MQAEIEFEQQSDMIEIGGTNDIVSIEFPQDVVIHDGRGGADGIIAQIVSAFGRGKTKGSVIIEYDDARQSALLTISVDQEFTINDQRLFALAPSVSTDPSGNLRAALKLRLLVPQTGLSVEITRTVASGAGPSTKYAVRYDYSRG